MADNTVGWLTTHTVGSGSVALSILLHDRRGLKSSWKLREEAQGSSTAASSTPGSPPSAVCPGPGWYSGQVSFLGTSTHVFRSMCPLSMHAETRGLRQVGISHNCSSSPLGSQSLSVNLQLTDLATVPSGFQGPACLHPIPTLSAGALSSCHGT